LGDGSRAVVLFNRSLKEENISVSWEELGYPGYLKAKVRDLWLHKDLGIFTKEFSAAVPSHDAVMITVIPE